jgi:hypothetical protein
MCATCDIPLAGKYILQQLKKVHITGTDAADETKTKISGPYGTRTQSRTVHGGWRLLFPIFAKESLYLFEFNPQSQAKSV